MTQVVSSRETVEASHHYGQDESVPPELPQLFNPIPGNSNYLREVKIVTPE